MTHHAAEQRPPSSRRTDVNHTAEEPGVEAKGRDIETEKARRGSQNEDTSQEHLALTFGDDDFPDGGLRAWLVVLGVGINLSALLRGFIR